MNTKKRFIALIMLVVMTISTVLPIRTYAADDDVLKSPSGMIAYFIVGLANGINRIISSSVGYQITIDHIVFNQYPEIKVDYFEDLKSGNYSTTIWGRSGNGSDGLYKPINETFELFQKIAIAGYMFMLVYMGIRITLSSTGESMAQYKTLFMYWVLGVAILFLYPFAMKYMIQINNTFVTLISDNKNIGLDGVDYTIPNVPLTEVSISDVDALKTSFEENPFASASDENYMTSIAKDAISTGSPGLALAYLIMTWQLIILTVHYYKRLFMIGFLIAIFPLVTLFYALDRIADGKSQAFNHWNKEFILNVFLQSFHAIIYAFVCTAIFAAKVNGKYDFIIVLVGVTFLFTGEEIIKKIFSQESPSKVGSSLAGTAGQIMKAAAITKIAKGAVTKVAGKNGIIANTSNALAGVRVSKAKLNALDKHARPVEEPNAGMRLPHYNEAADGAENEAEKAEALKLANAVATMNNPGSRSAEELARAKHIIDEARKKALETGVENPLLNDLRFSDEQMDSFIDLAAGVAAAAATGTMDPLTIDRNVRLTLGYTMNGMSEEEQKKYANMFWTELAFTGGVNRFDDSQAAAENNVNSGFNALEGIRGSFVFRNPRTDLTDAQREEKRRISNEAKGIAESMFDDDDEATSDDKYAAKDVAVAMAVIRNRNSGLYTANDFLTAASKIKKHANDNDVTRQLADGLDVDVELLRHMMAKQILNESGNNNYVKNNARQIVNTYNSLSPGADTDLDGHKMIEIMYENDDDLREAEKQAMIENLRNARETSNTTDKQRVRDIATEVLAQNEVDITEGGIPETRFFNGQTKEDIEKELRRARYGVFESLGGRRSSAKRGEFSKEYKEALDRYREHYRGDQDT